MPEFVLQLWAAMIFAAGDWPRDARAYVPLEHQPEVMARVSEMHQRWCRQRMT